MERVKKPASRGISELNFWRYAKDLFHGHFELIYPVFEKEDFPGFGVGVHDGQPFQASLADPTGESSGQQGGVEDIEVLCHDESFQASGSEGCRLERHYGFWQG